MSPSDMPDIDAVAIANARAAGRLGGSFEAQQDARPDMWPEHHAMGFRTPPLDEDTIVAAHAFSARLEEVAGEVFGRVLQDTDPSLVAGVVSRIARLVLGLLWAARVAPMDDPPLGVHGAMVLVRGIGARPGFTPDGLFVTPDDLARAIADAASREGITLSAAYRDHLARCAQWAEPRPRYEREMSPADVIVAVDPARDTWGGLDILPTDEWRPLRDLM